MNATRGNFRMKVSHFEGGANETDTIKKGGLL